MNRQIRKLNDETGVTLVELLAAIAILSIIVTAFLGFFIQAAKTNQHTNAVNEATFLAQEQMEEIIHNAPKKPGVGEVSKDPYTIVIDPLIEIINENEEGTGLYKVVVTVSEGGKVRAKMENILPLD